jgi:hypothetical protein
MYSQNPNSSDSLAIDFKIYPNSKTPIADSRALKYKIFRITEVEEAYIIDIRSEDNYKYTIISLKSEKQKLEKIKKGKIYEFKLFAYYSFHLISDYGYSYGIVYTIEGVPVTFREDSITGQIVTTPNLQGLYYMGSVPNGAKKEQKSIYKQLKLNKL